MGKSQAGSGQGSDRRQRERTRGRTPKRRPGERADAAAERSDWARKLSLALIPVVVGALIPIIFVYVQHRASPPAPHIEVDGLTVQDSNAHEPGSVKIHVLLRNTGSQLAIIKGVRLQVENATQAPICVAQGA